MRSVFAPLALAAVLAIPAAAQSGRFIKVDITSTSMASHGHKGHRQDGPTEVHMRMPISLAKGFLEMARDSEIKVNGESRQGLKPDALIKLLEGARAGDLLLELTTDKGDVVKITVE